MAWKPIQHLIRSLLAAVHLDERTALLILAGLLLVMLIGRMGWLRQAWRSVRRWWPHRRLPRPLPAIGRAGYVYVIRGRDDGLYKIGLTVDPVKRLQTFQTARPDLSFEHLIRCRDRYAVERRLHEQFARKRRRGEWFALDRGDLEAIKRLKTL